MQMSCVSSVTVQENAQFLNSTFKGHIDRVKDRPRTDIVGS